MNETVSVEESKRQLASLQKSGRNNACIDCNAPSPSWAVPNCNTPYVLSPIAEMDKDGIFVCLDCSGVHRLDIDYTRRCR